MATGWVKSLQCKSNALDDVYRHPPPPPSSLLPTTKQPHHHSSVNNKQQQQQQKKKKTSPLLPLGCGSNTSQTLRDVVALIPHKHPLPKKIPAPTPEKSQPPRKKTPISPPPREKSIKQTKSTTTTKPPKSNHHRSSKSRSSTSATASAAREPPSPFTTLTELPAGHSSRGVVEIIFGSSWSRTGAPFPGEIEMLFKVRNPPRTVARFEEYREAVRSRAGPGDARCAADGNEMMRFHCSPAGPATTPSGDPIYDAGVICSPAASGGGIRTFSGSGGAHDCGGGGGVGIGKRRAMLVCRVIAGRVRTGSEPDTFESVSVGKGELLVFDQRAVLPCFLIIYKL